MHLPLPFMVWRVPMVSSWLLPSAVRKARLRLMWASMLHWRLLLSCLTSMIHTMPWCSATGQWSMSWVFLLNLGLTSVLNHLLRTIVTRLRMSSASVMLTWIGRMPSSRRAPCHIMPMSMWAVVQASWSILLLPTLYTRVTSSVSMITDVTITLAMDTIVSMCAVTWTSLSLKLLH